MNSLACPNCKKPVDRLAWADLASARSILRGNEHDKTNRNFRFQSCKSRKAPGTVGFPRRSGIVPGGLTSIGIFFAGCSSSLSKRGTLNLIFEYSGETHCDNATSVDAPSPSKAHIQTARAGVTSGAQDFENVEQFGHRHLNRAESKNHPAKDSKARHSSATQQACRSIRNCRRQVESGCCDCGSRLIFKVRCRFRVLPVRERVGKQNPEHE